MVKSNEKETFNFEGTLKRLETAVTKMESGDLSLEDALKQFETGIGLIRQCQESLQKAEQTVEVLIKNSGKTETMPYENNDNK